MSTGSTLPACIVCGCLLTRRWEYGNTGVVTLYCPNCAAANEIGLSAMTPARIAEAQAEIAALRQQNADLLEWAEQAEREVESWRTRTVSLISHLNRLLAEQYVRTHHWRRRAKAMLSQARKMRAGYRKANAHAEEFQDLHLEQYALLAQMRAVVAELAGMRPTRDYGTVPIPVALVLRARRALGQTEGEAVGG